MIFYHYFTILLDLPRDFLGYSSTFCRKTLHDSGKSLTYFFNSVYRKTLITHKTEQKKIVSLALLKSDEWKQFHTLKKSALLRLIKLYHAGKCTDYTRKIT